MLLRLTYLGVTNALALLRLMPMSDRDKDTEILVLRHQIALLQRQLGAQRPRFGPSDRALLAALLHRLPMEVLKGLGGYSYGQTPSYAGTATSSPAATHLFHGPNVPAGRARCGPSASWRCAWRRRTPVGAIDVCTASCSCWV